jgi:hypothetical protein
MKDHFVKLKSFRYVRKEMPLKESDPISEFVVRSTVVLNLADVLSYTHPSECDTKLIAMKKDVEIEMKNLTAVRMKADGGSTTNWLDIPLEEFDAIFQAYLFQFDIPFTDYTI